MSDVFLYTFPQWIIFGGLFAVIYGWVESKKSFRLAGISIFVLLGILALVVLAGNFLPAAHSLTPDEVVAEAMEEELPEEVPLHLKLLPAYWSFLIAGILAIPTFFLELREKKAARTLFVATALAALLGFFIIVGAVRAV